MVDAEAKDRDRVKELDVEIGQLDPERGEASVHNRVQEPRRLGLLFLSLVVGLTLRRLMLKRLMLMLRRMVFAEEFALEDSQVGGEEGVEAGLADVVRVAVVSSIPCLDGRRRGCLGTRGRRRSKSADSGEGDDNV